MQCPRRHRLGCISALALALWSEAAQAEHFHYRYVSLEQAALDAGFQDFFFAGAIDNGGRVYGTVRDGDGNPHVAVYDNGAVTAIQPVLLSAGTAVNEGGTVGGFFIDPLSGARRAALFRGGAVVPITPPPGEFLASVVALNDPGTALVVTRDLILGPSLIVYQDGVATPANFGPGITLSFAGVTPFGINNQGIISGTSAHGVFDDARGFRFDPRTGEATLLEPILGDPLSWAQAINNRGDILGYSFCTPGFPVCTGARSSQERIGVWDHGGTFTAYFTEGNPEVPTRSSILLFNDNNLIVITDTSDGTSYLVPKPGERLDLADLVDGLPQGPSPLFLVAGVNNHGDIIGSGPPGHFLLVRTGS